MDLTDLRLFSVSKWQCKLSTTQMARFYNSSERRRIVVSFPDYYSAEFSLAVLANLKMRTPKY